MIKRVGPRKYVVMDPTGKKKMSKPMPRGAAVKRLSQQQQQQSGGGGY